MENQKLSRRIFLKTSGGTAVASMGAAVNKLVQLYDRGLAEGDVIYRLENIDVGGGLVLGLFTVDYRDPG